MSAEKIKFLLLILAELIGVYLLLWLGLYAKFLEGDFSFVFEYFMLSWSGGGELPALIQSYALTLSCAVVLLHHFGRLVRKYYL